MVLSNHLCHASTSTNYKKTLCNFVSRNTSVHRRSSLQNLKRLVAAGFSDKLTLFEQPIRATTADSFNIAQVRMCRSRWSQAGSHSGMGSQLREEMCCEQASPHGAEADCLEKEMLWEKARGGSQPPPRTKVNIYPRQDSDMYYTYIVSYIKESDLGGARRYPRVQ